MLCAASPQRLWKVRWWMLCYWYFSIDSQHFLMWSFSMIVFHVFHVIVMLIFIPLFLLISIYFIFYLMFPPCLQLYAFSCIIFYFTFYCIYFAFIWFYCFFFIFIRDVRSSFFGLILIWKHCVSGRSVSFSTWLFLDFDHMSVRLK